MTRAHHPNPAVPALCERLDSFALVKIARENQGNTLNLSTLQELNRIFSGLQKDNEIRAVILTGSGEKAFSAGIEIEEISALTPEQAKEYAREGQGLTDLIEDLGKPVIGAINGLAHGGGCELAAACAWRIAVATATFAQPAVKLGLAPGFGGSTRLPNLMGKSRALEMILTGDAISAEEALRTGLVNRLVADRVELINLCQALARRISRNAPRAVSYALEAVNHGAGHGAGLTLAEGLRLESALFALCFATEDVKEGTRAFLEKRDPDFKGR
jgi:enoyl-CoA hydratase